MRDDGLNVSFKVSLVENPAISKTITCRSLFRAKENFVALEGSSNGAAIIERLVISQDAPPIGDPIPIASLANDASSVLEGADFESAMRLDDLTPANSRLLLQDDFDDGTIDLALWSTLGEVVPANGQVQLGLPNEDQHIDTWRARPYLITREKFDPSDGPLVILGKATFAENFLHGYGGSFAVMTRAVNAHGGGPGWENSILRRGVRFNFWPAAYGFDHSLEIHEKPSPSTIRLLTSEGFRISPNSRSYLFRIIDDGRSATITCLDAANPIVRKKISHRTTSLSLSGGHIGFESCWGSPVLLDNVRIFRSANVDE
jgi:hypothetical protein